MVGQYTKVRIGALDLGTCPLLLAPMEDVSDPPFRMVCKQAGGVDLMYSEFISSEGLIRHAAQSVQKLDLFPYERPIGIQLFGHDLDSMRSAARLVDRVRPDVLDINYGCPVKNVACKGAGAALLKDLKKMELMTRTVVQESSIPVTVKTRLGWDSDNIRIVEAALRLQDAGIQALTIHGRTRAQMYKGQADWTWIARVKAHPDIRIPIFGNGDITSPQKAKVFYDTYGLDGLMVGRAAIGNPWIFREIKHFLTHGTPCPPPSVQERVDAICTHLSASLDWKGLRRGIHEMRKHYRHYLHGIPHISALRLRLLQSEDPVEIKELLYTLLDTQPKPSQATEEVSL